MTAIADIFNTPLRAAALGVLLVAAVVAVRGLVQGRAVRVPLLALAALALGLVLVSEALR